MNEKCLFLTLKMENVFRHNKSAELSKSFYMHALIYVTQPLWVSFTSIKAFIFTIFMSFIMLHCLYEYQLLRIIRHISPR
jgi:hypothetical protein